ncbi:hypothetical protein [Methylosinus sporium]|uniref:hypothetical protein n=1 Tax=Methylosinus sporium TaxID=428 RepID=UPI00383A705C
MSQSASNTLVTLHLPPEFLFPKRIHQRRLLCKPAVPIRSVSKDVVRFPIDLYRSILT